MLVIVFIVPAIKAFYPHTNNDFTKERKELDSILLAWEQDSANDTIAIEPVTFNPNSATINQLVNAGLSSSLATRIDNYRKKGGHFKVKSDLLKMYGMDSSLYLKLFTYIDLPEKTTSNKTTLSSFEQKQPTQKTFDLNKADTSQLKTIYGIGSKLSVRIIRYRDLLGGFISMNQLYEVYNLDSAVISELEKKSYITSEFTPKKISINSATEKELAAHPYLSWSLAKAITAYRFQHGNYSSIDDLKKITLINDTIFQKISPYISITQEP